MIAKARLQEARELNAGGDKELAHKINDGFARLPKVHSNYNANEACKSMFKGNIGEAITLLQEAQAVNPGDSRVFITVALLVPVAIYKGVKATVNSISDQLRVSPGIVYFGAFGGYYSCKLLSAAFSNEDDSVPESSRIVGYLVSGLAVSALCHLNPFDIDPLRVSGDVEATSDSE